MSAQTNAADGAPPARPTPIRLAVACLVAHAALSCFSAIAFATFLSGPPPDWLLTPAAPPPPLASQHT